MITTTGKVFRHGSSAVVVIPAEIMRDTGIQVGHHIEFTINNIYTEEIKRVPVEATIDEQ